jgi:hypothetical protein
VKSSEKSEVARKDRSSLACSALFFGEKYILANPESMKTLSASMFLSILLL